MEGSYGFGAGLLRFLRDKYGNEDTQGVDVLWNPHNHRVLHDDDIKILRKSYSVNPWQFLQRAVSLPHTTLHP